MNTPDNSLQSGDYKCKKYRTQFKTVFKFLYDQTASRYMVAIYTGVPIQNVCRYVDLLRKRNTIAIVRIDKCKYQANGLSF